MSMSVWLSVPLAWAGFDSATFNKQKSLKILRITPSGVDVPTGRQIVFTFNQPVVALGKNGTLCR